MHINGYVKGIVYGRWLKHVGARSCPIQTPYLRLQLREVIRGLAQVPTSRCQDLQPDLQDSF